MPAATRNWSETGTAYASWALEECGRESSDSASCCDSVEGQTLIGEVRECRNDYYLSHLTDYCDS